MRTANAKCVRRTVVAGYAAVTQHVVSPIWRKTHYPRSCGVFLKCAPQLRRPFAIAIRNCEARIHHDSMLVCVEVLTCRTSDTVESSQLTD